MHRKGLVFTALCFLAVSSSHAALPCPQFLVATPAGQSYVYSDATVDNSLMTARITDLGNDQWKLEITAKQDIRHVWFPWQPDRTPLDNDITDDIFYYPYLTGKAEKASTRNQDWTWSGLAYPGLCYAPLVVMADGDNARIVAATNWPPRKVTPFYAAQRLALQYQDVNMKAGATVVFQALIAEVQGNDSEGSAPWQLALDKYRTWLDSRMTPVRYPMWMQQAEGWFNVGLMNMTRFDLESVRSRWNRWKEVLPWIQFWGQMSNYAGPSNLAVPPLLPDEKTGCCHRQQEMHSRYLPALVEFVRTEVTAAGYHAGFYSAPFYEGENEAARYLDTPEGRTWLQNWLFRNRVEYGANAYYIDVLGAVYWGNPETVMELFTNGFIPENSVIEYPVDIYPSACLISGSLTGGSLNGGPGITPETANSTTFPRFGRYLLGDRIMFLGQSNGDHKYWGPSANYWTERQAFLLGAKLDASNPDDNYNAETPNPYILAIKREHDRTGWWSRQPRYLDTRGLSAIPPGVEVRRFLDKDGKNLFAVDNPNEQEGLSFSFQGRSIPIPAWKIAAIDESITGVGESSSDSGALTFRLERNYPNPFNPVTTISFTIPRTGRVTLSIYNALGQEVATVVDGVLAHGAHTATFDARKLASGLYFYRLKTPDAFQTRTMMLVR
jgi:hypothetical protein